MPNRKSVFALADGPMNRPAGPIVMHQALACDGGDCGGYFYGGSGFYTYGSGGFYYGSGGWGRLVDFINVKN